MEGIAGTFGFRDRALVRNMLEKLEHRGPEVADIIADTYLVLGARRPERRLGEHILAVAEEDGVAVACDSYFFNKDLLRKTIVPSMDERAPDSRLILGMYKTVGTRIFSYLDGAYAIAILDKGKTILARDQFGLKPLYFSGDLRRGSYSSEMKSQMLAGEEFRPFPPGKMFVSEEGFSGIEPKKIPWAGDGRIKDPSKHLHALMVESVLACMDGTDKLNILLSGGIDSSVVASAASELTQDIHTACVGMADSEDLKMAEKVSDLLHTRHRERVYSLEDMINVLDKVIYYTESFDFPVVRSAVPNYMATQLFKDRRRITLLGEGGDEVFAGHDYMRDIADDQALRAERASLLSSAYLTKLQRADRMTACASLDARLPLMNQTVIEFGLSLGRKELMGPKGDQREFALRKAFEKNLPKEVFSRRKKKFSDSALSIKAIVGYASSQIPDAEFEREKKALPGDRIRTKEELLYFRIFQKHFPGESALASIGSLDPRGFPRKTI